MIEVKDISFSYGRGRKLVLDKVGFTLQAGECMAILGNNGVGKSTLLKCIDRIEKPFEGSVLVEGSDVLHSPRAELAKKLAYVPQRCNASHIMVFDAVLLGRKPYIKWDVTERDKKIVSDILTQFELDDYKARYMNELSGGEMQKVLLARAVAQQPRFLLLDEPTSNLDPYNQHEMLRLMRDLARREQIAIAIVIHDLNLAFRYCDRFLLLKDSRVYSFGGVETVTPEAVEAVYGMKAEIIEHRGHKILVPMEESV